MSPYWTATSVKRMSVTLTSVVLLIWLRISDLSLVRPVSVSSADDGSLVIVLVMIARIAGSSGRVPMPAGVVVAPAARGAVALARGQDQADGHRRVATVGEVEREALGQHVDLAVDLGLGDGGLGQQEGLGGIAPTGHDDQEDDDQLLFHCRVVLGVQVGVNAVKHDVHAAVLRPAGRRWRCSRPDAGRRSQSPTGAVRRLRGRSGSVSTVVARIGRQLPVVGELRRCGSAGCRCFLPPLSDACWSTLSRWVTSMSSGDPAGCSVAEPESNSSLSVRTRTTRP